MYARMSELFAVPKNENIWRGKELVLVFSREQDYLNFEMKSHATMAAGTAGMCHQFGNGDVHIAFYRQPNDMDFAPRPGPRNHPRLPTPLPLPGDHPLLGQRGFSGNDRQRHGPPEGPDHGRDRRREERPFK